ncbi:hypothetical protein [Psychromonas sp. L1A2]|uniref:hypothetical protein n=1 Tax=Psychromonas sp. L1A2 TaxID=2686356 RepID=UPI00135AFE31|nr:hypothetical protein [Psychromonas sp. L1A2]
MLKGQQSALLSEQELQLLLNDKQTQESSVFPLYSMIENAVFVDITYHTIPDVETLTLLLSTCPLGSGVILTELIEQSPHCHSLLQLLKERADIHIFWLGELPSMAIDLPHFDYCQEDEKLIESVEYWKIFSNRLFEDWLNSYRVGLICETPYCLQAEQLNGLNNITFYSTQQSLNEMGNLQLLMINLNTPQLRLMEVLNNLISLNQRPFLLLYGDIQANLSHALYDLTNSLGFPVLASLRKTPTTQQLRHILITLFSKIYLKHLVQKQIENLSEQPLFVLDNINGINEKDIKSIFCPYGLNKNQMLNLKSAAHVRKIINVQSIFDWFPDGFNRDHALILINELGCSDSQIDLYLKYPQSIVKPSSMFSLIVMARLNQSRVYWLVEEAQNFSIDMLMFLPISDIILSKALATELLDTPSQYLLDFIEEARQQNIRLGIAMEYNSVSVNALSLYGIEFIIDQRTT